MRAFALTFLACLALPLSGVSQSALSPVVGFLRFDCPAGSDTRVSVPFHPAPRWAGRLASDPSDLGGGLSRLSLASTPGFASGELTDEPHYLYCREASDAEGRHFLVQAHGANHLDIVASPGELSGLASDSPVSVVAAWRLETLFPPESQSTFHPSAGPLATQRGSELLLFDETTSGSNLAPARRFFVTGEAWIEAGSYAPAGEVALVPGQAFLVRHPAGVSPTAFVASDHVYGGAVVHLVRVSAGKRQDTPLALLRPVPLALGGLDLDAVFEESASTALGDRRDELLVYDNAAAGLNKGPSATYFRVGGEWVEDADGYPASDTVEIEPAAGIVLRKAPGVEDGALLWTNLPTYDLNAQ